MIYVGIDDTDMPDTPGTNQLARELVARVADRYRCVMILRHQLFYDPRVPYTSKNGSASILLEPVADAAPVADTASVREYAPESSLHDPHRENHFDTGKVDVQTTASRIKNVAKIELADAGSVHHGGTIGELIAVLRERMLEWYVPGSDPGLCVTTTVPGDIVAWGQRCQRDIVTREQAEELARRCGIYLEGLGGTRGGMIGALAAVGLASTRNDGRVVVHGDWPDDLSGRQPIAAIDARGIEVHSIDTGEQVRDGQIEVGKHLRPNLRAGRIVLFVQAMTSDEDRYWQAIRMT